MKIRFPRIASRFWFLLFAAITCLPIGCAQLELDKSLSVPFLTEKKDNDPQIPTRVVAIWVDTIRYTQGETPTRGFGGRLMFYRGDEEKPVKVDGDLVVYAFDEDGRTPADPRPTRKYVFRADQLEPHYSESKIGHSYNFFLPWDYVGGLRKEISLIVRFQPKLGPVVVSEQTRHILPGMQGPEEKQLSSQKISLPQRSEVRAASFESDSPRQESPAMRMQTSTIPLPTTFGQTTPKAEVRPRFTRSRYRAPASTRQEPPKNQDSAAQPSASSRLSRFPLQGEPIAQPERGRVRSQPRLAEWQSPGRSTPEGATGFGSR